MDNASTGNTSLTLKAKQPLELVKGRKNVVQAQRGEHYRVVVKTATGEEQLQNNVIARKKGQDLLLSFADGTELQLESYYVQCKAGDCDLTLPSASGEGLQLSANAGSGAALADGSTLSYAHGSSTTLMQMAQGDAALTSALAGLHGTMVTYHLIDTPMAATSSSSAFSLWTALGALGVVAGAARWEAGHSDTAAANHLVQGQLTAGPLVSGHGLRVDVFQADGKTKFDPVEINADGSFNLNVGAYTGVIVAIVTDTTNDAAPNAGVDYRDEASGRAKNLGANTKLMAVANVSGGTTFININPITTIAALKAGMTIDGGIGNNLTALGSLQVNIANAVVGSALALDDIMTTKPVTTVTEMGTANLIFNTTDGVSSAEKYGALLASLSGVDQAHSTATTIQLVSAGIASTGNLGFVNTPTQALLVAGAATAAANPNSTGQQNSGQQTLAATVADAVKASTPWAAPMPLC